MDGGLRLNATGFLFGKKGGSVVSGELGLGEVEYESQEVIILVADTSSFTVPLCSFRHRVCAATF